jgi:hypothetical protein
MGPVFLWQEYYWRRCRWDPWSWNLRHLPASGQALLPGVGYGVGVYPRRAAGRAAGVIWRTASGFSPGTAMPGKTKPTEMTKTDQNAAFG